MAGFGDYQLEIYFAGLSGVVPSLPMTFGRPPKTDWNSKGMEFCRKKFPTYSAKAVSPGPPGYAGFTLLIEINSAKVRNRASESR